MEPVDDFTLGYLECAAWADCTDDHEPGLGSALFSDEFIEQARKDCQAFQDATRALLDATDRDDVHHAWDFWLTRNHHGAGFWDRGDGDIGDALTAAAQKFPPIDCYLGDDGKIYGSGS